MSAPGNIHPPGAVLVCISQLVVPESQMEPQVCVSVSFSWETTSEGGGWVCIEGRGGQGSPRNKNCCDYERIETTGFFGAEMPFGQS